MFNVVATRPFNRVQRRPAIALSLPAEILCMIFLHLAPHAPSFRVSRGVICLGWVASVTHVCRKWREVALNFPELWAQNLCALPSLAATHSFFNRAKDMPLVFRASRDETKRTVSMTGYQARLAITNMARVEVFDQPLPEPIPEFMPFTFIESLKKSALPDLTFMRIHRWDSAGDKIVVDCALAAPALRELHLDCIFFSHIDTPQLRVLSVTRDGKKYGVATVSVEILKEMPRLVMLETLKSMPLLEQITIGEVVETDYEYEENGRDAEGVQVELVHLQRVHLRGIPFAFGFYSHVRAANTTHVEFHYTHYYDDDLQNTFEVLDHHLRAPGFDVLTVHEEEVQDLNFSVYLYSSTSAQTLGKEESSAYFGLRAYENLSDGFVNSLNIINSFVPHIDTKSIRFLDYSDIGEHTFLDDDVNTDTVRATLAPFVGVITAQLSAENSMLYVSALRGIDGGEGHVEGNRGQVKVELPLPALQHLIVHELYELVDSLNDVEESWRVIVDVLEERKVFGQPLRFLTLTQKRDETFAYFDDEEERYALEACDAQWMQRAETLVEKVYRRVEPSREASILDYILEL